MANRTGTWQGNSEFDKNYIELYVLMHQDYSRFHLSVESKLHLLWFCITTLSDWLKKPVPLSQPITSKTKTNCDLLLQVFPMLRVVASSFDWTMDCSASFVIDQSNYFGVGVTTLNWKLL